MTRNELIKWHQERASYNAFLANTIRMEHGLPRWGDISQSVKASMVHYGDVAAYHAQTARELMGVPDHCWSMSSNTLITYTDMED